MKKARPKKSTPRAHGTPPTTPRPSTPAPAVAPVNPDPARAALTPRETRRLLRISRFLLVIRDPALFRVACTQGYSAAEHDEGWTLFRRASGEGEALRAAPPDAAPRSLALDHELRAIDAFENLWFPRVRAVIERVVPAAHRAEFAASFFRDLTQQPLGPGVVVSVRTLLDRVAALPTSGLPGAAAVRDTLRARGLGDEVVRAMRARVAALASVPAAAAPVADEAPDPSARRAAYEALSAWFNDWATTLRTAFDARELVQLGLRDGARRSSGATDDADDDTPADH